MLVTLEGIVTEVRGLQPANAYVPMLVTPFPIVTEEREEQAENALTPMLVTMSRSVRYLSDLLPRNAWPIDVMPRVRDSSASHPRNTFVPILVTPYPIITDERDIHL